MSLQGISIISLAPSSSVLSTVTVLIPREPLSIKASVFLPFPHRSIISAHNHHLKSKCLPSAPINNYPMRSGTSRCMLCDCYLSFAEVSNHENGKRHLQKVASSPWIQPFQHAPKRQKTNKHSRKTKTKTHRTHPSQMTSNVQSAPPANISPPVGVNMSTCDTDPRVHVSGEGGLYFFVEGSGTSGNPVFLFSTRNILIEKTNLPSGHLSLLSLVLTPPRGSWCDLLWPPHS